MFYTIVAIIIGLLIFINSIFLCIKKEKIVVLIYDIFCGIGLVTSGIGGFFIPKDMEYITILLLLCFSLAYLIFNFILLKKRKKTQTTEQNS